MTQMTDISDEAGIATLRATPFGVKRKSREFGLWVFPRSFGHLGQLGHRRSWVRGTRDRRDSGQPKE